MDSNRIQIGNTIYSRAADGYLTPIATIPAPTPKATTPDGKKGMLDYYLGGTGIPERLRAVNNIFNPVEAVGQSMDASRRMFAPGATGWERTQAAGDMLSGVASVLPLGKVVGATDDLARGAMKAEDAARDFAVDEFGGVGLSDPIATRGAQIMDMLRSGRGADVTDEMLDMGDATANARLNEWLFNNYDLPMDAASRAARAGEMTNADAFHATAADFTGFEPSNMRGASFFAPTPDGAVKGAQASATEGFGSGARAIIPVRINTSGVEGLGRYREPQLNAFADSLQNRMYSEPEMDAAVASAKLPPHASWSYFFDDLTDYDGLGAAMDAGADTAPFIKFTPKARPIAYGPDIERGLDGWQFPHYQEGMSEAPISRAVSERGNTGFVMMDEGGASIAMTDPRNIRSRFARFDPRLAHLRNLSASGLLPFAAFFGLDKEQQ